MTTILVIEDDEAIRENLLELLEAEGFEGVGAADGRLGVKAALARRPDLVICDVVMPELDGYGVLQALRSRAETEAVPFIFLSARADRADVRAGMNLGADDYVTKPFTRNELLGAVRTRVQRHAALRPREASSPVTQGRSHAPAAPGDDVVRSDDPAMREIDRLVECVAVGSIHVLLLGETGVGKEVFAERIHRLSRRRDRPFLRLNCSTFTETLLESELFGHERGAFTGAVQKQGLLESINGGTVFLDEIGEVPLTVQVKLLRVLEERQARRVGALRAHPVDVRFVAATNRDLTAEIAAGRFRSDLYFRLGGATIVIPPLRDRPAELEPLARRFLRDASRLAGRGSEPALSEPVLALLRAYRWPGNIRELRNVMELAALVAGDGPLTAEHLPPELRGAARGRSPSAPPEPGPSLRSAVESAERDRIVEALAACDGSQTDAARRLGISRRGLINKVEQYGLPRPRKG